MSEEELKEWIKELEGDLEYMQDVLDKWYEDPDYEDEIYWSEDQLNEDRRWTKDVLRALKVVRDKPLKPNPRLRSQTQKKL